MSGILGIGVYLPDEVRRNDWWPADVVSRWLTGPKDNNPVVATEEGAIAQALRELAHDPFGGAVERRVMPATMHASDMEILAAQRALQAAKVDVGEVGLVLLAAWMPDLIGTNAACTIHAGLGMRPECLSMTTESSFNGFAHQVDIAAAMIDSGRVRYALLVQSSSISRLLPYDQPHSPWSGDGATAVVMGPVAQGFGVLGSAHGTDGSLQGAVLIGVPGGEWYDVGKPVFYAPRPELQRKTLTLMESCARQSIHSALASAGHTIADVDVYASHMPVAWFRKVTQKAAGLEHARSLDTFAWTGSLAVANVPMVLSAEIDAGLLREGDLVVTHAGGSGGTWSSLVMRWGRGDRT